MKKSNYQRRWEREEVVVLVSEYFRTKNSSAEETEKSYQNLSEFLRKREKILTGDEPTEIFRDYAGIRMQMGRIRCLDPDTHYCGMKGTKIQEKIVGEYLENPNKLVDEAYQIYKKYE